LNIDSSSFKEVYKKRTSVESIFSKLADMTNSTSLRFINAVEAECNLYLFLKNLMNLTEKEKTRLDELMEYQHFETVQSYGTFT